MLVNRKQVSVGNAAVWDRLYAHLALLTSRGSVSVEDLTDVFAPLLITCNSQCLDQVYRYYV